LADAAPASSKSPESPRRGRPAQELPPALADAIRRATDLLASAVVDEALARYGVAEIVAELMRMPDKYGMNAVARLARALRMHPRTLYQYAGVVEAFPARDFAGWMEKRGPGGRTLRWSVFLVLAEESDAGRRTLLATKALAEAMSVRALREEVHGNPRAGAGHRLQVLVDVAVVAAKDLGALLDRLDGLLAARGAAVAETDGAVPALHDALRRAGARIRACADRLGTSGNRADECGSSAAPSGE